MSATDAAASERHAMNSHLQTFTVRESYSGTLNGMHYRITRYDVGRELVEVTTQRGWATITRDTLTVADAFAWALSASCRTDETGKLNLYGTDRSLR